MTREWALLATPKPRARNVSPAVWGAVSLSGSGPDLWGAGDRPVVDGRSGLARVTRASPVRDRCAFRAQPGLLPGERLTQSRAVSSRSDEPPTEPALARSAPGLNTVQPWSGLVRTGVLTTPPVPVRTSSLRFRQSFCRGVPNRRASGPQVRCPRAKTHRLPPAKAPSAPAIRSGRKVRPVSHGAGKWAKSLGDFCAGWWV